ncbi:hypothetical protein [Runella zeae]|uniref:hypothetical protein n=1 Tax=Runella zeae TaxID=94255 RepID=UPI0004022E4E|nr:hypothetical protein [Runella zeae]
MAQNQKLGTKQNPHEHTLLKVVKVKAHQSDASETVAVPFNNVFRKGLFIAMSDDRTFHLYRWEDIAGKELKKKYQRKVEKLRSEFTIFCFSCVLFCILHN